MKKELFFLIIKERIFFFYKILVVGNRIHKSIEREKNIENVISFIVNNYYYILEKSP